MAFLPIRYGAGTGTISLTQVQCDEDVSHILRCSVMPYSRFSSSCEHRLDVAVECSKYFILRCS